MMASRNTAAAPRPNASTSSVRRNLFHHHLSRRPASSSTSTSASTLQGGPKSQEDMTGGASASTSNDTGEIVSRDKNGRYAIEMPVVPPMTDDEDAEGMGPDGERGEKEKIEASLVELMYRSRGRATGSEPEELLTLVQSGLQKQVASLEEDKWMYEPEGSAQT